MLRLDRRILVDSVKGDGCRVAGRGGRGLAVGNISDGCPDPKGERDTMERGALCFLYSFYFPFPFGLAWPLFLL